MQTDHRGFLFGLNMKRALMDGILMRLYAIMVFGCISL